MNGREHFIIGAATTGIGLWGTRVIGLQLESATILAGALMAGVGSLAPDIDHPHSTISHRLPTDLLDEGLKYLLVPVVIVVILVALGDFQGALKSVQALSQTWLIQLGLILVIPAIVLKVISGIISAIFRHRGATHSFVFAVAVTVIVTTVCPYCNIAWWYGLLFGWGWISHLLVDATTEMGLPSLLWPFVHNGRRY